jgi:hypothetical protein
MFLFLRPPVPFCRRRPFARFWNKSTGNYPGGGRVRGRSVWKKAWAGGNEIETSERIIVPRADQKDLPSIENNVNIDGYYYTTRPIRRASFRSRHAVSVPTQFIIDITAHVAESGRTVRRSPVCSARPTHAEMCLINQIPNKRCFE